MVFPVSATRFETRNSTTVWQGICAAHVAGSGGEAGAVGLAGSEKAPVKRFPRRAAQEPCVDIASAFVALEGVEDDHIDGVEFGEQPDLPNTPSFIAPSIIRGASSRLSWP